MWTDLFQKTFWHVIRGKAQVWLIISGLLRHLYCVLNHILLFLTFSTYYSCPYKLFAVACNLHAVYIQSGYTTSSAIAVSIIAICCHWSVLSQPLSWCDASSTVQKIMGQNSQKSKMHPDVVGHPGTFGILNLTHHVLEHTECVTECVSGILNMYVCHNGPLM